MDRDRLFSHLEQRYSTKREMIARIPLGAQVDTLWQELLNRRRSSSTVLPLHDRLGRPYWYVTTEKMVAASEKIVETLMENEMDFDPYTEAPIVTTLEEVFYTSYVDGSRMTMQEAMHFLQSESSPQDVEELLIVNNRQAGNYARANLYRPIDAAFLKELAFLLTDGMDGGGDEYRNTDRVDFTSTDGESLEFPMAQTIPDKIDELCRFLVDQRTHPLIKAGIAQAWTIVVRPFPDGNERLGRILSNIVLLRAGYSFFSEISLSALIARKGYGYYDSMVNIMREENGGDLTYFLEYFFELLSRAIDERRLRLSRREDQNLSAEIELAKTPLSTVNSKTSEKINEGTAATQPYSEMFTFLTENDEYISQVMEEDEADEDQLFKRLQEYTKKTDKVIGGIATILLQKLSEGTVTVTTSELARELHLESRQLSSSIRYLKINGILRDHEKVNHKQAYTIISDTAASTFAAQVGTFHKPDPEIMKRLHDLSISNSPKDKRIAATITECLEKGEITIDDYTSKGHGSRWGPDMQFAVQLGLVEKVTSKKYTILRELKSETPPLSKAQKRIITNLYDSFGEDIFSIEMVVATLEYSGSHASAVLHQFTLLKLIDCWTSDSNHYRYQFLVNPQDHPECFEQAA